MVRMPAQASAPCVTPERAPRDGGDELCSSIEKLQRELAELLQPPTLGKDAPPVERAPLRELTQNAGSGSCSRAGSQSRVGATASHEELACGALASYHAHSRRLARGETAAGAEAAQVPAGTVCAPGAQPDTPGVGGEANIHSQILELTAQKAKAEAMALLSSRDYRCARQVDCFCSTCARHGPCASGARLGLR